MTEIVIVGGIIALALLYTLRHFLRAQKGGGCGCGSCTCDTLSKNGQSHSCCKK